MTRREDLDERARKAILQKSLFRWENAAVISGGILLATFDYLMNIIPYVPAWVWPIGGLAGAAALFYSSLTDPDLTEKAVADMLRETFQPQKLADKRLQSKINEALSYHSRILQAIEERGQDSMIGDELRQAADHMDDWIKEIYDLAQRLDRYQRESQVFGQNRERARLRLNQLQQRLQMESNPAVREEIQANLESLNHQIDTLAALEDTMQRAELMLDNKLTSMGTIYLQSTLAGAKEIDNSRAQRLRHEIAEQVQEMDDILLSLDEVYKNNALGESA